MILSRLLLDRQAMLRLKVTDQYSLHRIVYHCFPRSKPEELEELTGSECGTSGRAGEDAFLFVDNGIKYGQREILIQSKKTPQALEYGTLRHINVPQHLLDHTTYNFQVVINPVKRNKTTKKLIPIQGREALHGWFCAKAPSWGFTVEPLPTTVEESGVWQFTKKNTLVTLAYAKFRGVLQVTDRDLFKCSFHDGIGRAKAFGCGMLQILPVR